MRFPERYFKTVTESQKHLKAKERRSDIAYDDHVLKCCFIKGPQGFSSQKCPNFETPARIQLRKTQCNFQPLSNNLQDDPRTRERTHNGIMQRNVYGKRWCQRHRQWCSTQIRRRYIRFIAHHTRQTPDRLCSCRKQESNWLDPGMLTPHLSFIVRLEDNDTYWHACLSHSCHTCLCPLHREEKPSCNIGHRKARLRYSCGATPSSFCPRSSHWQSRWEAPPPTIMSTSVTQALPEPI